MFLNRKHTHHPIYLNIKDEYHLDREKLPFDYSLITKPNKLLLPFLFLSESLLQYLNANIFESNVIKPLYPKSLKMVDLQLLILLSMLQLQSSFRCVRLRNEVFRKYCTCKVAECYDDFRHQQLCSAYVLSQHFLGILQFRLP